MSASCGSLEAIKDSRRHESKLSEVRRQSEYWELLRPRTPPRHNSNRDTWYLLNTLPDIFSTLFCLPTIFHRVSYTHMQMQTQAPSVILIKHGVSPSSIQVKLKIARSKFWCIFVMDQYLGAGVWGWVIRGERRNVPSFRPTTHSSSGRAIRECRGVSHPFLIFCHFGGGYNPFLLIFCHTNITLVIMD